MARLLFILLVAAALVPEAAGQATLWGMAGRSSFDLSGTGTAAVGAVRVDYNLSRVFLAEVGLGYSYTHQQLEQNIPYLLPELQLQAQIPTWRVRPYVGAGAGLFIDVRSDRSTPYITWIDKQPGRGQPAFLLSGGLRAPLTERLGARLDLRVRGTDGGVTTDVAGGFGWRF